MKSKKKVSRLFVIVFLLGSWPVFVMASDWSSLLLFERLNDLAFQGQIPGNIQEDQQPSLPDLGLFEEDVIKREKRRDQQEENKFNQKKLKRKLKSSKREIKGKSKKRFKKNRR